MGNWVTLTELGGRRCTSIKIKWSSANDIGNSGNYNFTREYGVKGSEWGTWGSGFRFDLTAKNVCDYNINGGSDTFYRDFNAETYQGEYNGKKYYITYDGEYVQWEWTEPVYYYGFAYGKEDFDPEPIAADFIYVMLEGTEEPETPITIADNLNRIIQAKADIKTAIENKGVTVGDITIDGYAAKIAEIEGGVSDTKINVHELQIKLAYYPKNTIPEWLDFSNISNNDLENFFRDSNIENLNGLENVDVSKLTSLKMTFYDCSKLSDISAIYNWNVSNVTDMTYLFYSCNNLTNIDVSQWNTNMVTTMERMIYYNSNIVSLSAIYCGAIATKNSYPLYSCANLTDVGGFIDMKMSWDNNYGLAKCPNLTYQSCINVLNGLYDFVGNSETPNSNQGVLKVHANFLTTVGDEISIATNKGWQVIS
jgi:surface protein